MPSMMSLATATPSTSKRARPAPNMRSALSVLLAQVRGQDTRGRLNQLKILVSSSGQDRGVPEPEGDDQNARYLPRDSVSDDDLWDLYRKYDPSQFILLPWTVDRVEPTNEQQIHRTLSLDE